MIMVEDWLKSGQTDYIAVTRALISREDREWGLKYKDELKNAGVDACILTGHRIGRRFLFNSDVYNSPFGRMLIQWYKIDRRKGLKKIQD